MGKCGFLAKEAWRKYMPSSRAPLTSFTSGEVRPDVKRLDLRWTPDLHSHPTGPDLVRGHGQMAFHQLQGIIGIH